VGSDWNFQLTVPGGRSAVRSLLAVAAARGYSVRNGAGQITCFTDQGAELVTVADEEALVEALANGEAGQFWSGDLDLFLQGRVDEDIADLRWSLDSCWTRRRPGPKADEFRAIHARLVALWLEAAVTLGARAGRIDDDWSWEQVHDIPGIYQPAAPGEWPRLLGWWTYLGPPAPPPPAAVADRSAPVPGGGTVITLLDDPAAVDVLRYAEILRSLV
jgi:hypothetical protein